MVDHTDVAIVGAGPAGLSAAKAASECGLKVTLLDEQPGAGGQIYRAIDNTDDQRVAVLGQDYANGRALLDVLKDSHVQFLNAASVWDVAADNTVFYTRAERATALTTRHLIIATGAMERPMPINGWQLPGVMTVGAGQILLKSAGLLPSTPAVLAGQGPLLYLLATQYLRAGHPIAAIVDTTPTKNKWAALGLLGSALRGRHNVRKGLDWLKQIKKSGIATYRAATDLQVLGDKQINAVSFNSRGVRTQIECNTLLLHLGVVPNVQLTRMLGLVHHYHDSQRCWHPQTSQFGETNRAGTYVTGDAAGIGGADAARERGYLAGLHSAYQLGALDASTFNKRSDNALKHRAVHEAARPFLDTLYAPSKAFLVPHDDTMVCRCEEVTAADIRAYVAVGCTGPNQAKSYGRCGMGPCQGRLCGLTVAEIIAAERGVDVSDVGYYRIRPPLKPVTLDELAHIDLPETLSNETAPTL